MRWLLPALLLALLSLQISNPLASPGPLSTAHLRSAQSVDCPGVLARLTAEADWFVQLQDPVITSYQGLLERLALYIDAHSCLLEHDGPLSPELQAAQTYLEYFLIFTVGYDTPEGASSFELIDLATSDDPAVVQLREHAGLPPPPGYIFVRFYRSRQAMPVRLRVLFAEDTAGLTLLTRYIAILQEDAYTWEEQVLQAQTLPKTTSHELVHAYINASVGIAGLDDLPRWYAEGVAIHLSGSGEDHVVVGTDSRVFITSPADYREYRDNFEYLRSRLGQERLLEVIRLSVEQGKPGLVYHDLGYASDEAFLSEARAYWQRRFYLVSGAILAVVALVVWWLLRLMPEVRCQYCRYAGKRREFEGGRCPKCRFPLDR